MDGKVALKFALEHFFVVFSGVFLNLVHLAPISIFHDIYEYSLIFHLIFVYVQYIFSAFPLIVCVSTQI